MTVARKIGPRNFEIKTYPNLTHYCYHFALSILVIICKSLRHILEWILTKSHDKWLGKAGQSILNNIISLRTLVNYRLVIKTPYDLRYTVPALLFCRYLHWGKGGYVYGKNGKAGSNLYLARGDGSGFLELHKELAAGPKKLGHKWTELGKNS